MRQKRHFFRILLVAAVTGSLGGADAAAVPVRYSEGLVHGFLVLRSEKGDVIGDAELLQTARADTVTSRLVMRFRDGSLQDETAVFRQRGVFRLLSDHMIQKGPSFPRPSEMTIHAPSGRVVVKYRDKDGREKTVEKTLKLPADVANGIVSTLVKNLRRGEPLSVPMVAAAPEPLLVTLHISPEGEDTFAAGAKSLPATRYVVRVDIGGIKGALAALLGKNPPPTRVWVFAGEAPTFLKSSGPLYFGGPLWTLQLSTPAWPETGTVR
jgi:hypothetical protein